MSNEELVQRIQGGEDLYGELWGECSGLVAWKARQVLTALDGKGGVELADLVNSGFLAMVAAVESYQLENGAFSTWFMYHLKTAFAETTGYRTRRSRNDPIQCAVSLSTPLSDDGEAGELIDIIPDPGGVAALEGVEEQEYRRQLCHAMDEVLSKLPEDLRNVTVRRYLEGLTQEQTAAKMGSTRSKAMRLERDAMRALRKPSILDKLRPFLYFDYYRSTGITSFRSSGISVQERYLIRKERQQPRKEEKHD